uniref:NADH-ubiquinone oxidoreductase chain 6 n=1 Tax=Clytra quadripunctata TaxID=1425548 RepID=A0A3G1GRB5_9CUCU|nr:NADH dehydrogenase subunit 6 [Clytra quadripunctata]
MLISLIIVSSFTFCLMNHPLTSGLILLIQTVLIALISGSMNFNFWFSYIVFLIMIGGMLVLFIYMTSVASNEKFKFSSTMTFIILATIIVSLATLLIDPAINITPLQVMETSSMGSKKNPDQLLSKYLNYPHSMIYTLMVMYLLITLIAIVKITIKAKGTLRQSF